MKASSHKYGKMWRWNVNFASGQLHTVILLIRWYLQFIWFAYRLYNQPQTLANKNSQDILTMQAYQQLIQCPRIIILHSTSNINQTEIRHLWRRLEVNQSAIQPALLKSALRSCYQRQANCKQSAMTYINNLKSAEPRLNGAHTIQLQQVM